MSFCRVQVQCSQITKFSLIEFVRPLQYHGFCNFFIIDGQEFYYKRPLQQGNSDDNENISKTKKSFKWSIRIHFTFTFKSNMNILVISNANFSATIPNILGYDINIRIVIITRT